MSISLLKTLIAISELGSFSAAADHVHVSHAAVGQQMKRLEELLQVTLFDRKNRTPRLNQLGKALIPKAQDVVLGYETLLDDLTGDADLFGELTLGAVPSAIRGLVPLSIKALMLIYPKLKVRVVPGLSVDLQALIESGALDAAILSEPTRIGPNVNWQPFVEEELILLTSNEVIDDDPIRLMQKLPYIHHTRRGAVGKLVEDYLIRNNITVHYSMEMESLESLTSMVLHNLGISIVPNACVPDPIFAGLKKITLPSSPGCRVLGMLTRSDCAKIHLANRLLQQIIETVAKQKSTNV
ncbi:MAG: DNA-binding transcriptional LysR family regulator [Polaribacter sp.]